MENLKFDLDFWPPINLNPIDKLLVFQTEPGQKQRSNHC